LCINKPCHYEHVWIEINVDNCNYVIGGYYRHPNTPVKDFTDDFLYTLDKLKNLKRCYAFGDFNVCLANYSHHVITSEYIDAVFDSKFLPYVFMLLPGSQITLRASLIMFILMISLLAIMCVKLD